MAHRSRSIRFCYLCGARLPERPQIEHVVPKMILGEPTCNKPFPVTLPVHPECDQDAKQRADNAIQLFHKIKTKPVPSWPVAHLRSLPIQAEIVTLPSSGRQQRVFTGIAPLLDGVADWVRGFHASLYDCYLAQEAIVVYPPVPAANLKAGVEFEEVRQRSELIRMAVKAGATNDRWDGVLAWCDELRYSCVWYDSRLEGDGRWTCFWMLVHPGVFDWKVPDGSEHTPWHGLYFADCPRQASVLTKRQIDLFNQACGNP